MNPAERRRFGPTHATLKHGSTVTLRVLMPDDGDALGDFYESVPREDFRFYCPHALNREEAARKAARADDEQFVCLVAVDDAVRIAGYAWYEWHGPDSGVSGFGICIRREFQGLGLGESIMRRLFEIASEVGPPRMCLTVQKANERAVQLYQKLGFAPVREQECGERWGFAPEPEYYMERAAR